MNRRRPRRRFPDASVTLEFILILPFLVVMLLAVAQFTVALLVRNAVSHAATVGAREAGKGEGIEEVARAVDAVLAGAHGIEVATVAIAAGYPPLTASVTPVPDSRVRILLEVGQPDPQGRDAVDSFGVESLACAPPDAPVIQPDEVRVTVCIDLSRRPMYNWLFRFNPAYVDFGNRRVQVSSLGKKE